MKRKNRLILKQSLKYFVIILIAFLGMAIYRIMWALPNKAFYYSVGLTIILIIILAIFDIISAKDIIPIFKN